MPGVVQDWETMDPRPAAGEIQLRPQKEPITKLSITSESKDRTPRWLRKLKQIHSYKEETILIVPEGWASNSTACQDTIQYHLKQIDIINFINNSSFVKKEEHTHTLKRTESTMIQMLKSEDTTLK